MKRLLMVAGPNGAGKTTSTLALISQEQDIYQEFLNADQIAQGLSPLRPESVNLIAGRLMIQKFHSCIRSSANFVFETTGSSLSYANHLKKAQKNGYQVNLNFLWLSSPEQAIQRVAERVKQGGHDIPESDIRRRYYRGLRNLVNLYLPIADTAIIFDNSSMEPTSKKIVARKGLDQALQIEDTEIWEKIEESCYVQVE